MANGCQTPIADAIEEFGVSNSRKRAGFDRDYLAQLISGVES